MTSAATYASFEALCQVDPWLDGALPLAEAMPVEGRCLFHAGPPYVGPSAIPLPVLNAAAVAAVWEGWAVDDGEARELITNGTIGLQPAQDHGIVTPLAFVVSPSMWVLRVRDRQHGHLAYTPLNDGPPPAAPRLGSGDAERLARLQLLDRQVGPAMAAALGRGPVALLPLARAGLRDGDELHGQVSAANGYLLARLQPQISLPAALEYLATAQQFFLNPWMAACAVMLAAGSGVANSSLVVAAGGNGVDFGVQLASAPGQWRMAPAPVPQGPRLPGCDLDIPVLPAIGDSAVIDAAGFGALALIQAPALAAALASYLPADWQSDWARITVGPHPALSDLPVRVGLDAAAVDSALPATNLALLDARGERGLVGRGVLLHPRRLYRRDD